MISPDEKFMIQTSHIDIYREWEEAKKFFKARHYIFTLGLVRGILEGRKSKEIRNHDIVRLGTIRDKGTLNIISFAYAAACTDNNPQKRWEELLAFADAGLESLWKDYQKQNIIDIPRILDDAKIKWPDRAKELIKQLEHSK